MAVKYTNNAATTLAAGISAGATSFTVASATNFPTLGAGDHCWISLKDEVVKVTAITGTTFTCTPTVGSFLTGDTVELRMTAELLVDFMEDEENPGIATCKNVTAGTLLKGTPVYQSGTAGNAMEVQPADASSAATMPAVGVLGEDLIAGAEGEIIFFGPIFGVDTSAFSEGDTIYVAAGGGYTNVRPTGEANLLQNLGKVTKVHATNGGGVVMGAGRTNATPNLNQGNVFIGDATNCSSTRALTIADITALQAALDGKTTETYVNTQIANLIDAAPVTLDTLNELAASLNDDADFAGTMTTALAGKANVSHTHTEYDPAGTGLAMSIALG